MVIDKRMFQEVTQIPRYTCIDVYAQIEADLRAAFPVLDDITLIKGKRVKVRRSHSR